MASTRTQIAQALIALLGAISVDGGFNTDVGADGVYFGVLPALEQSDRSEAIALVFEDDEVTRSNGEKVISQLTIGVAAFVAADDEQHPGLRLEQLVEDVKRAIEQTDRTLGGLTTGNIERTGTRVFEQQIGSSQVGVVVSYMVPLAEQWGAP